MPPAAAIAELKKRWRTKPAVLGRRRTMSQGKEVVSTESVTRIDAPHLRDREPTAHLRQSVVAAAVETSPPVWSPGDPDQICLQAEQLADHLRCRLRDLDQRESILNGRTAELEAEQRTNRLWVGDRAEEFAAREAAIQQQENELQQRVRSLAAEESLAGEERRRQELELRLRVEAVVQRESRLADDLRRLAEQSEQLRLERESHTAARAHSERALQRQSRELDERQRAMEEAESFQHQERTRLAEEESLVHAKLGLLRQAIDEEQKLWTDRKQHLIEEWAEAQQALAAERNRLEMREEAIRLLHREASCLARQAMEARLVAEHLWLRLRTEVSGAQIAHSLGELRLHLADQYQVSADELRRLQAAAAENLIRLETRANVLREQRQALEQRIREAAEQADQREQRLLACVERPDPGPAASEAPLPPIVALWHEAKTA